MYDAVMMAYSSPSVRGSSRSMSRFQFGMTHPTKTIGNTRFIQTNSPADVGKTAGNIVIDLLNQTQSSNHKASIVFPTGNTPIPMYEHLRHHTSYQQWANSRLFHLDEYVPPTGSHKPYAYETYEDYMRRELWDCIGGEKQYIGHHLGNLKKYDEQIRENDGPDLVILGIGGNGHIAFNEPGSGKDAKTRIIDLAPTTMHDNFGSAHRQGNPTQAATLGLETLLKAKHIILMATGEKKRDILQHAFDPNTPPSSSCPASWLKEHPNVTVITDFEVGLW